MALRADAGCKMQDAGWRCAPMQDDGAARRCKIWRFAPIQDAGCKMQDEGGQVCSPFFVLWYMGRD